MGEALIEGSNWRLVEVGRVVVITNGHPYTGRLAAIVEIIDHKRVRSTMTDFPYRQANELQMRHGSPVLLT